MRRTPDYGIFVDYRHDPLDPSYEDLKGWYGEENLPPEEDIIYTGWWADYSFSGILIVFKKDGQYFICENESVWEIEGPYSEQYCLEQMLSMEATIAEAK